MTDAIDWAEDLSGRELSPAEYSDLTRRISEGVEGLQPVRLVLLSTYTTNFLSPYLTVEGARHGLYLDLHHGAHGQFEQELLREEWRGGDEDLEMLVLAMRPEDLDPDACHRYFRAGSAAFGALAADLLDRLDATIALFRDRSTGPVLVADFAPPTAPLGVFDMNRTDSLTHRIHELNRSLVERLSGWSDVYVWDYAGLVAAHGAAEWTDPRYWAVARNPVAPKHLPAYASHLVSTVRGVLRPSSKCLVLDLDDTLWGGVLGDDGVTGIQLGDDYPGRVYKDFQRTVLGLRDRGILLAVSSKNDRSIVEEAFREHPEMLLSMDDFAATRIDWNAKSGNLAAIAAELNIGLDSLVFFDDNPVERAEVAARAPGVWIVDVPSDPALYVRALTELSAFDSPRLTAADLGRAESYREQVDRGRARQRAGSLEDFLASLEMEARFGALDDTTVQRIGQLVAKTNQFNLTTRRQSEVELRAIAEAGEINVSWLRLHDRYGDMGLIAVGVLTPDGEDAVVHNLVLSCRAANRGIEQAMLAHLVTTARGAGFRSLVGEYIPTGRNHVVAGLYSHLGFSGPETDRGVSRFRLDLDTQDISAPGHIRVQDG